MKDTERVGIVVIGRNEGDRLARCLRSVASGTHPVVYVDSGSTDGSPALAARMGAHVVHLDSTIPFTAARARNAGAAELLWRHPLLHFVQFVDGDCEVVDGWLQAAESFLRQHQGYAVVSGRVRERHPERSLFNRLCDLEWESAPGDAKSCGGNAMMRSGAFRAVSGFDAGLIAGEEPELCVRLRAAGWGVYRLERDMVLHDADMTRFAQWWKRTVRTGHAFAEGAWMHGAAPERHWVRETARALVYGALYPAALVALVPALGAWALAGLALYPLQVARLSLQPGGLPRAFFHVLGRFPECWGVLTFAARRCMASRPRLIEYK